MDDSETNIANNMWHDQGDESDVGDVVFDILGKNSVPIPLFHIVFRIVKSFITLFTSKYPIVRGFASKWSIFKFLESVVRK